MTTERLVPTYHKREYLSLSTLLTFIRCPRRYFYQKSGIVTHDEPSALVYGTAMHKAVGVATTEGLDSAIAAFESVWDESLADNKRSLRRARAQLAHFVHMHSGGRSLYTMLDPPPSDVVLDEETSRYEIPFVIDVGLDIPIAGRLDGWCRHRDTGEYWVYEFKTTSRLTGSMFESLELNPQILAYTLVVRTLTQQPVRGVMFEAMLIDPSKVDSITHPVLVQDHHLEDISLWLRYWGELLLACERRGEFPKNFAGCSAYPMFYQTGSKCEYDNLCRVPRWQDMVQYYDVRPDHKLIDLTVGGSPRGPTTQAK